MPSVGEAVYGKLHIAVHSRPYVVYIYMCRDAYTDTENVARVAMTFSKSLGGHLTYLC